MLYHFADANYPLPRKIKMVETIQSETHIRYSTKVNPDFIEINVIDKYPLFFDRKKLMRKEYQSIFVDKLLAHPFLTIITFDTENVSFDDLDAVDIILLWYEFSQANSHQSFANDIISLRKEFEVRLCRNLIKVIEWSERLKCFTLKSIVISHFRGHLCFERNPKWTIHISKLSYDSILRICKRVIWKYEYYIRQIADIVIEWGKDEENEKMLRMLVDNLKPFDVEGFGNIQLNDIIRQTIVKKRRMH